jgi:hypothetical protein
MGLTEPIFIKSAEAVKDNGWRVGRQVYMSIFEPASLCVGTDLSILRKFTAACGWLFLAIAVAPSFTNVKVIRIHSL